MPPKRVKKVTILPINVIFSHLQVSVYQVSRLEIPQLFPRRNIILIIFNSVPSESKKNVGYNFHGCTNSPCLIFVFFFFFQQKNRVKIWLYEDSRMALEGQIIGFDEYMNMTLDNAVECDLKTGKREDIGRILLKGDAITLLQNASPEEPVR